MCRRTAATVLLVVAAAAWAERLPIRVYTNSDGLASTNLNCIVRDSRGLLWFCTSEGLSRFDGYTFSNYTFSGGAAARPDVGRAAVDFLETRTGELWALAPRALCRFNTAPTTGHPLSECYQPPGLGFKGSMQRLIEDPEGSIWVLHRQGLFRFLRNGRRFEPVDLGVVAGWTNLMQDSDGSLWVGGEGVLAHRFPDGRVDRFGEAEGMPVGTRHYFRVGGMLRDGGHRLWIATWKGLCLMVAHPEPGKQAVDRVYTTRDGLASDLVFEVFQSRDGKLLVSGEGGLAEWIPPSGALPGLFRTYSPRRVPNLYGMGGTAIADLAEDASGNLWLSGPARLARDGFTSYGAADGLNTDQIKSVFEDRDGRLIAISADPRPRHLNVFDGDTFHSVLPRLPAWIHEVTWGQGQIHFQDHTGAWWVAVDGGVCRYPRVRRVEDLAHTLPEKIYTARDGLPGVDIYRLFEDSHGDVWISVVGPDVVSRWSRATGLIENFRVGEGGRALGTPIAFAEDRAGNVWMSFYWRNLARYSKGRFEVFTQAEGLPGGALSAAFVDHAGRLWIASGHGLLRVDDPPAQRPQFRLYGVESGLSSEEISCIVEDSWGRIYAASPHGIDQLDPISGRIRHYGESAGLIAPGSLAAAYRDRHGNLWFAGTALAKFVPQAEKVSRPRPPIRIIQIGARGGRYPISELGQSRVDGLRLRSAENSIRFEFASLNFDVDESIRFQYKLEGSRQDWSMPTASRAVDYASLSSGSYRFLVRAVNSEGLASDVPASVAFVILPPFWQQWWFVVLVTAASCAAILAAHRYRVQRLLELERVRTRIATDLHDDVGSSLTQIAILSEVARRNGSHSADGAEPLERIADLSRGLVDSMSDIVWSINPQRDHLSDVQFRMRRFASDVLAPRDIDFELTVPEGAGDIGLDAEVRRQLYLVFKEFIHNAVRHADCKRVRATLETRGRVLTLRLIDDGKGFPVAGDSNGHGLANMRRRAAAAGGHLRIESEPGRGTIVTLQLPAEGAPARSRVST